MISFVAERGEQVVGMLLSTMPLAERMLLYNLAMAAMVMLPGKSSLPSNFQPSNQ